MGRLGSLDSKPTIGIVAPSSVVPKLEFSSGVEKIRSEKFQVIVHKQCFESDFVFAGSDESRAKALFSFAHDRRIDVIWCARGGYGANRLLPILDRMTRSQGSPKKRKLLIGASDSTSLLEYVRTRWGWKTLHASMPGVSSFHDQSQRDWKTLLEWIQGGTARPTWDEKRLTVLSSAGWGRSIEGELIGGNLSIWSSLQGTSYLSRRRAAGAAGKPILFLEDVGESMSRIDRMVTQLSLAGTFDRVRAIVLGTFHSCEDRVPLVWKRRAGTSRRTRKPLRKAFSEKAALKKIFEPIGARHRIPVFSGLPVGHGPGQRPLPLGVRYRIEKPGYLCLRNPAPFR